MRDDSPSQISQLLAAWGNGDSQALDQLMPRVYKELRSIAAQQMRRERPGRTLQTTELVNEAFLKLVQQEGVRWSSRSHFYAIAATAMRRILVDHARARRAQKRGGDANRVSLDRVQIAVKPQIDLIDLEDCLLRLEKLDPQQVRIVELRYFAGCTIDEVAEVLEISASTVKREWRMAKIWLRAELQRGGYSS
jgi:RNA polymerase sigma-70 factor (ECF subfamily)